jgi:hypothetical protein
MSASSWYRVRNSYYQSQRRCFKEEGLNALKLHRLLLYLRLQPQECLTQVRFDALQRGDKGDRFVFG